MADHDERAARTPGGDDGPAGDGPARGLVPSARQLAEGDGDQGAPQSRPQGRPQGRPRGSRQDPPPTAPSGSGPRTPRWTSVRGFVKDLDPRGIAGPKLPLALLGLSALLASWDDVALSVLLPEMRAEFGFSLQFLLTLGSVLGVVTIVLAPAMGYLADRVKRVWMLRIGGLIANGASIVQGLAPGIPRLVAGRAAAGLGQAIIRPAGFPLLTDYFPSRSRARVFAFLGFMGGLGTLAAPAVAGNLAGWFDWRFAVVSLGAVGTLVTLGFFWLKEPVRGYQDRKEMGADEATAKRQQRPVGWIEGWRAARSITTLRRLWYATPFLHVAWVGVGTFLGLYFAEEFGLGPQARGYIGTLQGSVALLGIVVAAPLADRLLAYRPGRVMAAFGGLMVLYAASVVVLAFSPSLWVSVVAGLPLEFGFVAIGPALNTLVSLVVPARIRGMGLQTIAPWQLLGLVAMPFIGRAADLWGLRPGLLTFVPLFLVGALILLSSSHGVDRDVRAAKAASLAEQEERRARAVGRSKLLICRDVDVSYDSARVLFHVDLDVDEGEAVALVGTNGAGKSSLLRAIAGVHEASNGAIFFAGEDTTHLPADECVALGVVFVPGGDGVLGALTVKENLRTASRGARADEAGAREATEHVLDLFPVLRQRSSQRAGTLSGGEQRMLALAQALILRPRLLLIDELSLGLAPATVDQLVEAVRRVNAAGTTVVCVDQSLTVATRVAQRAVFLDKGEVRYDGPADELLERPELVRSVLLGGGASAGGRLGGGGASAGGRLGAGPEEAAAGSHPGGVAPAGTGRAVRVSGEPLLHAEHVAVRFGGVQALDDVSVEVGPSEVVGLIGPNGAGKTTFFDVLSGFVAPDAGAVLLDGESLGGLPPDARARRGLGRSFQQARLFPALTVRECVAVGLERHASTGSLVRAAVWTPGSRAAERAVRQRVDELVDLLSLRHVADKRVSELSTGTRRVVDLACVMAAAPRMLLLDEPSAGLAQAEAAEFAPLLARVVRETGCGVLLIEHDIRLVTALARRVVALDLGRVVTTGPPDEVVRDPAVVAAYLAASDLARTDDATARAVAHATPAQEVQ